MHRTIGIPRLVIAGTHSGVGKTTIATALMAALTRRGKRVQPFKAGPDFIDPTFHRAATARASRNLDGWMLTRETNLALFARACEDADIAIVEGVMGLFDGRDGSSDAGSTAELAKWLSAPVILIVDGSAMARSAAALVRGFETFDPDLNLAGVIFNRIAGQAHFDFIRAAVEPSCRALPLGFLTANPAISFPDRHLGLFLADEVLTPQRLEALTDWIESSLDLNLLLELAATAPAIEAEIPDRPIPQSRARIGIARDRAFCLYYQDNLDLLTALGCELVEFSPLSDSALPENLNGLYLGGGYPELHAAALSANASMLMSIRQFALQNRPICAECGGFMYLCESIIDLDGAVHPMTGLFPTRARMQPSLAALGYIEVEQLTNDCWLRRGEKIRGHEFRYSQIDEMPPHIARNCSVTSIQGTRAEGFSAGSVLAGYIHLHFASCPEFAERFVKACSL